VTSRTEVLENEDPAFWRAQWPLFRSWSRQHHACDPAVRRSFAW